MKNLKARWRVYVNLVLLFIVLVTSFQNCSKIESEKVASRAPLGVEIETE